MRVVRRYLVLLDTPNSHIFDRFYDYIQYATKDFVMIDSEAFIIDSYLEPGELSNEFINNISSTTEFFICEITGEITWRNAVCGFDRINRFVNKR